jgi:hypothetical protein
MFRKVFDWYVNERLKHVTRHLLRNYSHLLSEEDIKRMSSNL